VILRQVVCIALQLFLLILFARAILSWFPAQPGSGLASVTALLERVTDPVIQPVRRVVPRTGMFDLSFLVVFVGISLIINLLGCGYGF
jgi:YggT family protein